MRVGINFSCAFERDSADYILATSWRKLECLSPCDVRKTRPIINLRLVSDQCAAGLYDLAGPARILPPNMLAGCPRRCRQLLSKSSCDTSVTPYTRGRIDRVSERTAYERPGTHSPSTIFLSKGGLLDLPFRRFIYATRHSSLCWADKRMHHIVQVE